MGICANGYRDSLGVGRFSGAAVSNNAYPAANNANFHRTGATRNLIAGQGITNNVAGIPYGYRHPGAWMLPMKAGALSSFNNLTGTGTIAGTALAVKLATADITGSGDLTAIGGLIVQALADLTGSGDITSAGVQAFLAAVASISGSGEISDADASGLGELICALTGMGTTAGSTASGTGELSADIVVTGTGLTTGNVGQAVWSAIATANNVAGTMGEKLNDAGGGANPWSDPKALTVAKFVALK